ncbi:precorrin-2 dehydrogenase/sirohydrochlorin ferrochelatase family protein [Halococcus hamelinensis]|uniref:precorrin-2 dehydrogenase n=1 Tax=Halococcus hamelinensis 100A6 TaxID=1132509 RepID=M0LV16_9EURY|nr:bifunctional precorrin-2 dehydrogenase/sirohydrochlorin ferrochelatase [Halococcus hamelinensis]EMA36219.1 siroheme synthase [Halococcus hamelinensis 100A6]
MIPLLHDFTDSTVLVFGGGTVGARKARRFAREARVVVVSPTFTDAEFGDVERVRVAPTPDKVPEWFDRTRPALAVAATDDEDLNDAIARAARERGSLLNRADRSRRGNESVDGATGGERSREVVVPATVRDDPVVMAVATGGRSPALSRYLRERFETEFAGAGAMADLTADIRAELRDRLPPEKRRAAVRAVVRADRVWKALGNSRTNARQEANSVICDMLSGGDGR